MAKRKKAKKTTHHRRHRISGIGMGHFNVMDILETGFGLIIGTSIGSMTQKYLTMVPQKVVSVGQLVLGAMNTHRPNKLVAAAAWGLAGAGALGLAHQTGIMHGIDEMVSGMFVDPDGSLNGYEEGNYNPQMNGMSNDTFLSGMPNGTTLGDVAEPVAANMNYDAPAYPGVMGY